MLFDSENMIFSLPEVLSANYVFALVLTVIIAICFILYHELSFPKGMPPGPFPIPIVGHLPFLGNSIHLTFEKLGKKYGSIYRIFLGNQPVIILNDYKAHKEAFLTFGEIFSGRPKEEWVSAFPGNENIINSDGTYWRDHRRFALTLMRDCGVGKLSIEPRIMDEIYNFIGHLKATNGKPTDIRDLLGTSVSNNICIIILGKRFKYTDPAFQEVKRLLNEITSTNNGLTAINFMPWLKSIPGHHLFFKQKNISNMTKNIDDFVRVIAKDQETNHTDGARDDYPKAFLTERKARLQKNPRDDVFNDVALISNMRALMAAGTETTTSTLLWGLIYMMIYPDIQKKVQDELDAVVGSERNASWYDKALTPYTEATLCEIQRISSIVPTNLPHRNKEECQVLGYTIPKSSFIVSNLYSVLHDPQLWKDPETFRPERFLSANGTVEKPEYFMPFSIGRRQCMGEILARMELYLYFTTLLQHFTFKSPVGVTPRLDFKVGTISIPKYFLTCATPRKTI